MLLNKQLSAGIPSSHFFYLQRKATITGFECYPKGLEFVFCFFSIVFLQWLRKSDLNGIPIILVFLRDTYQCIVSF